MMLDDQASHPIFLHVHVQASFFFFNNLQNLEIMNILDCSWRAIPTTAKCL